MQKKKNPSFSNESKGYGFQVLCLLVIIQVDKKTFFLLILHMKHMIMLYLELC